MIFQAHAMSSNQEHCRVTVLHDYQNVAPARADWSVLDARIPVTVFNDHLADADTLVERLQPFDMVCVMRKRTAMTSSIIERLPRLRLIASTAMRNAPVDLRAAEEHGVRVVHTGYTSAPTIRRTHLSAQGKRMKPCTT
jgi:lactate dehydrogenase-like 2-hydroxyacid dehydrogenase